MNENLKDQDVLLVRQKDSGELNVAQMDKKGNLKSVKPDEKNSDFMKIDKHGNILENFFENFMRQVKNPTHFEFFRVPAEKFKEAVEKLQKALENPDKAENKQLIDLHRIDPNDFLKKQAQEQTSEKSHAIDPALVKWDKLEKFGISCETLEKTGISKDGTSNLDRLLGYQKTNLVTVAFKLDDETTVRTDARISLRKQEDGSLIPAIHPIRYKPDLDSRYFGVQFTDEDKKNMLTTGNLGRVVEAEFKQGEKTPVLLSIDKLTNEIVPYRTDWLKIPETYKGVQLNEEQRQKLSEGKTVRIENMYSPEKDKYYSANVQFNAANRCLMPLFDNDRKQNRSQSQQQDSGQRDVPKTFRGKTLTEDQRDSLREGKAVNTGKLMSENKKEYSGYIKWNNETGKMNFMFPKQYEGALAAGKVTPDDRNPAKTAKAAEKQEQDKPKKKSSLKF